MTVKAMGQLPREVLDAIEAEAAGHRTLEDVVRWGMSATPPRLIEGIVTQDEYTLDVVIAYPGGAYLVYDTT